MWMTSIHRLSCCFVPRNVAGWLCWMYGERQVKLNQFPVWTCCSCAAVPSATRCKSLTESKWKSVEESSAVTLLVAPQLLVAASVPRMRVVLWFWVFHVWVKRSRNSLTTRVQRLRRAADRSSGEIMGEMFCFLEWKNNKTTWFRATDVMWAAAVCRRKPQSELKDPAADSQKTPQNKTKTQPDSHWAVRGMTGHAVAPQASEGVPIRFFSLLPELVDAYYSPNMGLVTHLQYPVQREEEVDEDSGQTGSLLPDRTSINSLKIPLRG